MPKQKKVELERKPLYTQNSVLKFTAEFKLALDCAGSLDSSTEQNLSTIGAKLSQADRDLLITLVHTIRGKGDK